MDNTPKPRFPEYKAPELVKSGESLQRTELYNTITSLEAEVSSRYTPDSIRSTFELRGLEPSLAHPLPESIARYHEVGAIKGVQIHFDATVNSHEILADISIAVNADTTRIINIGPSNDDKNLYEITENGEPLDDNMSQSDIEGVLLSLFLPPHVQKLLEAKQVFNGDSKLDLESPKTFHLLSQVLRGRSEKAVEVREYSLPATANSTASKIEVVENNDNKEIIFFSGSTFIDRPDGVDEIKFTLSTVHHTDLDIFEDVKIDSITMLHNNTPLEVSEPLSESVKIGITEIAIKLMSEVIEALP